MTAGKKEERKDRILGTGENAIGFKTRLAVAGVIDGLSLWPCCGSWASCDFFSSRNHFCLFSKSHNSFDTLYSTK